MSNYKKLIDEAMKTAQYRLNAGVDKTASAPGNSSLIKEASELANALEYVSMQTANNGTLAGDARAEMIRDFHKSAAAQRLGVKLAGNVGESSTDVAGMQAIAPHSGKTKLMNKKESNGNPLVTASPDSHGNEMLESYKQADSNQTLYDILMHQKEAGDVGEMDSEMAAPGIPSKNENSNRSILNDAYVAQGVSKQEAKAPTRARLSEAFASTNDYLGDKTVKRLFPQAYQKGGLKKVAAREDIGSRDMQMAQEQAVRRGGEGAGQFLADNETIKRRLIGQAKGVGIGGLGGAALGAGIGALTRGRAGAGVGAMLGGLGGALTGQVAGQVGADRKLLAERGIHPSMMQSITGMGGGQIDREVAAQHGVKVASMRGVKRLVEE